MIRITSFLVGLACFAGIAGCDRTLPVAPQSSPFDGARPDYVRMEETVIRDKSDGDLLVYTDRPDAPGRYPMLLAIDGSGCSGWRASAFDAWFQPGQEASRPYARVFIAKRGVGLDDFGDEVCSDEFLKTYTIDQRVEDHLRLMQHLRAHADWWDGTLYVAGWSDGGDIAAQFTAYYPGVDRAMLGAMGGGTTMAEQFRDDFVCPKGDVDNAAARRSCIAGLTEELDRMRDNPTWTKTWSGHANSHRVWASRLDTRLTPLLADMRNPVLVVHGERDVDSVPVGSARAMVAAIQRSGEGNVTYWEVPGMAHTIDSLPETRARQLRTDILNWLLDGTPAAYPGLPD